MKRIKFFAAVLMFFSLLAGSVFSSAASASAASGAENPNPVFRLQLKAIALKTYNFYKDNTDPNTGLTYDEVRWKDTGKTEAKYTSPTNISMYLMSTVSAQKMGLISRKEAVYRIQTTIHTLQKMDKWNGLFYNWYNTDDGSMKKDWGQFISQVDNGWLSAGLIVAGQAYHELYGQTSELVKKMNFTTLYDPSIGQFFGGYDVAKGQMTASHYGMFYTEPRVASYISIGKGDVPEDHWWKMYRTLPAEWDWQSQIPAGPTKEYDGVSVFEGHYEYQGVKYVPSWGGSMFEALMPGMVLKEKELGTKGLGLNDQHYAQLQIAYAKQKGYKAWGISPCATPDGYNAFAATPLGTSGYQEDGTVTAHATFLAMEYVPKEAQQNLMALIGLHDYGPYGFYDSVNVVNGNVAKAYLALDQGMIMVSIANNLEHGVIRNLFHHDPIGKKPENLLSEEEFSIQ